MFRRVIAGFFLGPALLIGSFSWAGFLALRTVFDSSRSATIAQELFDNEEVRSQLADNIASAVEAALPDEVSIDRPQVAAAAERILADPQVENLVIEAFSSTHAAFLGEGDAPRTLDLTPVAAMVRQQLASTAPALAARMPADESFVVTLPTDQIPDASPVSDFLRKTVPVMAAISVIGLLIALLATSDRPSVLKRAAGWAIGTTAVYLIIGLGIPELLRRFAPDQAKVVAALLTALLRSTLVPSVILAIVGGVLLVLAFAWPDRSSRRPRAAVAAVVPVAPQQPVAAPVAHTQSWPVMPQPVPQLAAQPVSRPTPTPAPQPAPPPLPPTPAPGSTLDPPPAPVPVPSPLPPPAAVSQPAVSEPPAQAAEPAVVEPPAQAAEPAVSEPPAQAAEPAVSEPPAARQPIPPPTVLPTRATASEPVDLPAWTGEPASTPAKQLAPKWVDGHGWVLDPDDPRPPPDNARWVEGVGHVVPGPPP